MLSPDFIELVLKQKNRKHGAALARAAQSNARQQRKNLPELLLRRKKPAISARRVKSQRFKKEYCRQISRSVACRTDCVRRPEGKDKSWSGRKG
ncbi:hypothetical protein OKW40_006403 [Paraburkholderia sp. RAU6.4a]|uniref:hypothetical protein n=1 Tax=Paraburkholderia sp. RAU6.4a TaxID=2991067 RepID=UPI003D23EB75